MTKQQEINKRVEEINNEHSGETHQVTDFSIKTREASAFESIRIPEGIYKATFVQAKITGVKTYKDDPEPKEVGFLEFDVTVPKKDPVRLSFYITDFEASEGNRLGHALKCFMPDIQWGKNLMISDLYGSECRVMVEDYEKEYNGEKQVKSSITKIKPLVEGDTA